MKKLLTVALSTLLMAGCASTSDTASNEVIPYDHTKSKAWNVMNQVDSAYKLDDMEAEDDTVLTDISATGHAINTFFLSPNFVATFGASMMADDKYNADRAQIITALDFSGALTYEAQMQVAADAVIDSLRARSNTFKIENFRISGNKIKFTEISDDCTAALTKSYERYTFEDQKNDLEYNECYIFVYVQFYGGANPELFSNPNHSTVRLSGGGSRMLRSIYQDMKTESFLYYPSFESSFTGKPTPFYVEKSGTAHLFFTPNKSNTLPIEKLPNQREVMYRRHSVVSGL